MTGARHCSDTGHVSIDSTRLLRWGCEPPDLTPPRRVGTRGAGFQIQTFFLSTLDHLPTMRLVESFHLSALVSSLVNRGRQGSAQRKVLSGTCAFYGALVPPFFSS